MKYKARIRGISPILFNRFPDEENTDGKSKRSMAVPSKEEQVETSLYRTKSGKLYQPAAHIVGSMLKAAVNFKLKGRKTFKDVVNAGIFVEPEEIIHKKQKYETDWRSVVIKSTRGRVMKGRGRMNEWELEFTLTCIDPRATNKDIKDILEYAGAYVGIGDYRPRYGRFEVVDYEEILEEKRK